MKEFKRDNLDIFLPKSFKGLDKEYFLDCIFNDGIQNNWIPSLGDIIVGCTGNLFVISGIDELSDSLGGTIYYFGGGSCNRDEGIVLDSTYCYTANMSGKYIHPTEGEQLNYNHSSIRDFRYVPYPHEIYNLI